MKPINWALLISIVLLVAIFFIKGGCKSDIVESIYDPFKDPKVIEELRRDSVEQAEKDKLIGELTQKNEALQKEINKEEAKRDYIDVRIKDRQNNKNENVKRIRTLEGIELEKDVNPKLIQARKKLGI